MMGRVVTVDLDKGPRLQQKAVRAWNFLRREADEVEIRVSSSGEGLHIIGKFEALLSDETMMELREQLEDDINRMRMDEQRLAQDLPAQVLWDEKASRDGSADRDFGDIWAALEFIDDGTSDYDAVHGWAQHGHKSGQYRAKKPHARDLTHQQP